MKYEFSQMCHMSQGVKTDVGHYHQGFGVKPLWDLAPPCHVWVWVVAPG